MGDRKMVPLFLVATAALVLLQQTHAGSVPHGGKRVLVLLQDVGSQDQYSSFFGALRGKAFQLDVKGVRDSGLRLREFDTYLYDHLILFAPKADGFGGNIDTAALVDFVDSGHNLLLGVNSDVSETLRNLAAEMGVDLDDKGTKVYDHFDAPYPSDPTLVASTHMPNIPVMRGNPKAPVLFRGIAQSVPSESTLVTVALSASETAYSHDPRKAMPDPPNLIAGGAAALVTAVQARNNARVVVAGSVEMFTDALINAAVTQGAQRWTVSGNGDFTSAVALWAFQDFGVLVATNLRHHIIGSDAQPSQYRVSDDVEFLIDIVEVNGGKQTPYKGADIQLEFTMLDPHVRMPLTHNGAGTFSAKFKVPDVYGVFKYTIDYVHAGYSYIKVAEQIPVRPFKHDEYERFLVCAYPYYASAVSSMVAFFVLGLAFLYHK